MLLLQRTPFTHFQNDSPGFHIFVYMTSTIDLGNLPIDTVVSLI